VLIMLEDLFRIFETLMSSRKNNSLDFNNLLKKKFIEDAEKYHFLDPFAAEFEYSDHKIKFTGKASDAELSRGVISAIEKIAYEYGMLPDLQKYLALWYNKYEKKLTEFNIDL